MARSARDEKMDRLKTSTWICDQCALSLGGHAEPGHLATYHVGTCDVCLEEKAVTEPRDWNGLYDEQPLYDVAPSTTRPRMSELMDHICRLDELE